MGLDEFLIFIEDILMGDLVLGVIGELDGLVFKVFEGGFMILDEEGVDGFDEAIGVVSIDIGDFGLGEFFAQFSDAGVFGVDDVVGFFLVLVFDNFLV